MVARRSVAGRRRNAEENPSGLVAVVALVLAGICFFHFLGPFLGCGSQWFPVVPSGFSGFSGYSGYSAVPVSYQCDQCNMVSTNALKLDILIIIN